MSVARRHHIISQCYLRGFTRNGAKHSQLFVVDLHERKTYATSPVNVAVRRDFNAVEGETPGALEAQLAHLETKVKPALEKIGDERSIADSEAWNYVLNLMALFAVRHPRIRESTARSMVQTAKIVMEMMVATPERYASELKAARAAGALTSEEDVPYEKMREYVKSGRSKIGVTNAAHIHLELGVHDAVLQSLGARQWRLCIAEPGAGYFASSDQPLVLVHSDEAPSTMMRPVGHDQMGTTVFFPLNRELLVVGTFEGPAGTLRLDRPGVAASNAIIAIHADRQVFGTDNKFQVRFGDELVRAADLLRRLQ